MQRLVPADAEVVAWVSRLPSPVAVAYEAGPTGFGLARAFKAANELRDAGLPESAAKSRFVSWTEAQLLGVAHVRDAWARLALARKKL